MAKFIADAVEKDEFLEGFENIDGVVPIVHGTGCGMSGSGEGYDTLFRTLTGYVQHPNFGATLLIELGCEVMTLSGLVGDQKNFGRWRVALHDHPEYWWNSESCRAWCGNDPQTRKNR